MKLVLVVVLASAALGAPAPGTLFAGEDSSSSKGKQQEGSKAPNAVATLQRVAKNLKGQESYRVKVDIRGGFATDADHSITETTVREAYEGEIHGTLMSCKQIKAFRTPRKGAAYVSGQWRDILSNPSSMKMERLFRFPEEILGRALKNAGKGTTWLALAGRSIPEAQGKKDGESDAGASSSGGARKPAGGGTTVVVTRGKKSGENDETSGKLPNVLRVELPPEEALTQIITVQNSNCFGGG